MKLPRHIVQRMRETLDALESPGPYHIDDEAKRYGGIALMGTIGATWLLRPDGTFLDVDSDFGKPPEPLDPAFHITALVAGSERYAWLTELLPQRPASARDCEVCRGVGRVFAEGDSQSSSGAFCPACNALGWTASDV